MQCVTKKRSYFRRLNLDEYELRCEVMGAGYVVQRLKLARQFFPDLFSGEYTHDAIAEFIGAARENVTKNIKKSVADL